jgi:hypothetical protein
MAIVRITGIVKTTSKDYLANIWEEYIIEMKGTQKEFKRKWTIWFEYPHGLLDGDRVTIEGELGTKSVEWQTPEGQTKNLVDHVINSPKLLERFEKKPERVVDLDDLAKYGNAPF